MFCFCAGFFSAFENIILLAVNLCQLAFNSSHVKANHRTTDAKLPHRAALMCLCAGPLEAVGSIHRCCTGTVLGSSVVSFFSGCPRGRSMFLIRLGCNRSGGKRDSSAWHCSPSVISSLPALRTADVSEGSHCQAARDALEALETQTGYWLLQQMISVTCESQQPLGR